MPHTANGGATHLTNPARAGLKAPIFLACLLAVPAAQANSHKPRRRVDAFVEGGGSFFDPGATPPVGRGVPGTSPPELATTTQSFQNSGRLFAGVDIWLTPSDAVQISYAYSPADVTLTLSFTPPPPPGSGLTSTALTAVEREHVFSFDYIRSFRAGRRWRMFLAAGAGGFVISSESPSADLGNSGSAAFNLGGGVEYDLSRRWALRAEYRDFILRERFSNQGNFFEEDHSPTLGLVYRF